MEVIVDRRADHFLRDEIEEAFDPLVAVEHAPGRTQPEDELLVARGAVTKA